jgi:hypothetical protein
MYLGEGALIIDSTQGVKDGRVCEFVSRSWKDYFGK